MSGDSISAELVDYLNDEPSPARRAEIEQLLRSDPERAREFEEYKKAKQAIAKLRVRNASPDFDKKVQERIAKKVEELRARGSVRFRTARERVEAAREGLGAEEIKRRSRKAAKLYVIAFLAVLPVLALGVLGGFIYFREKDRQRRISEQRKRDLLTGKAQAERRKAPRLRAAVSPEGRLQELEFLRDRELRLVPHQGRFAEERCIFIYTPEQWKDYLSKVERHRGLPNYASLRAAADGARRIKAKSDTLYLPPALHGDFLGAPAEVMVLRMPDRAEIWLEGNLTEYLAPRFRLIQRRPKKR